ncbi:hypothetical protein QYE76_062746 [Lolium multiflorum]|uniref:Transposase (putative) gypsy type domain-containing protein n=1 Tax=Lolium multiflorum TaxID=4521 RepID=A0AAD8W5Y1_LOLMU|nr:hypothetical protein QYE76_062746 [Lolium multiflorum]
MPRGRYGTCPFLLPRACLAPSLRSSARCSDAVLHPLLANLSERSPRRASAELPPQARQSGATGPRASTARSSPPRSPPARSGSSSPFRLSWTSSSSSSMAQPSGSWKGSYMQDDDIARFVRLRRIPAGVITRAPGEEQEPRPEPGERVVFGAHLDRGLGLPASDFFRRFLDHFGLQPHHLPANAMILLSCYVAFMEGYAGLWPDVEFWSRLFYIKAQTTEGLRTCGAASIYPRTGPAECRGPPRTYISRRVVPLQWRVHKIGHMSGLLDPTRTSKLELSKAQVAHRVNNITKANMPDNWEWGLRLDREQPPR